MKKILNYVFIIAITFFAINSNVLASCASYTDKDSCITNKYYSCIWNETEHGNYCGTDNLQYVQCADAYDIPQQLPELTSFGINFLKIVTPIILIITSIITLVKSLMASKEDEIKKATSSLKRKIIAATLVFFVIYIVQFVIMKVADSGETDDISTCLSCFINNDCQDNLYYKVADGSTNYCIYFNSPDETNRLCDYNIKGDSEILRPEGSCNGQYIGSEFQPASIMVDGHCLDVEASDKEVLFAAEGVNSIWTAGEKYFYWDNSKRKYIEVDSNVEVITANYSGSIDRRCSSFGYYSGYQPKAVVEDGMCYSIEKTGIKTPVDVTNLLGEEVTQTQNIWKAANNKCYVWKGDKNSYEEVPCDILNQTCNGKYFEGGYQPKSIVVDGGCHELYWSNQYIYVVRDGYEAEQKVWAAGERHFYWDGSLKTYEEIPSDIYNKVGSFGFVATRFYLGPVNEESCSLRGYMNDGYMPKMVWDNGDCRTLEKTEEKATVFAVDRKTKQIIEKEQIVWKTSTGNKWVWIGTENKWSLY